jgi:hypothetical protein
MGSSWSSSWREEASRSALKKTTRDSFSFEQMLQKLSGRGREGVMGGVATWRASSSAEDEDKGHLEQELA